MRVQPFPLDDEKPARLELRWEDAKAHVLLDGVQQATLDGFAGLRKGWSTVLADGSTLEVRTIRRVLFGELSVLRNGQHVRSSPAHPEKMLRSSSNGFLIGSLFLLLTGLFGVWGNNLFDAVYAVVYIIAALLLRSRRRLGAAVAAIPLFINLDLLLLAAVTTGVDRTWAVDLLFNLLFATFVVRAYQAARDARLLTGVAVPAT